MKDSHKKILQTLVGLAIGGAFLYFTLKGKNLGEIVDSLMQANISWMLMSGVMLLVVFLLRSLRWEIILHSSDMNAKKRDVMLALLLGYFVNSFTPKVGEIIRCTNLKRNYGFSIPAMLGTVVTERIYDVLVLILGLLFFGFYEVERLGVFFEQAGQGIGATFLGKDFLVYGFLTFVVVLILTYVFRHKLKKYRLFGMFYNFVSEMYQAVVKTFRLKKYNLFLLYTLLIWVALVLMNYCFLKALPETDNFSMYFAMAVLFVGGIGWAIPVPAGIGTTHFFILQLFIAFSLSESAGVSFGILSNGLNLVFTLGAGLIAVAIDFYRKHLSQKTEQA